MLTVVHATASSTSSRDEMEPVQSLLRTLAAMVQRAKVEKVRRRVKVLDIMVKFERDSRLLRYLARGSQDFICCLLVKNQFPIQNEKNKTGPQSVLMM